MFYPPKGLCRAEYPRRSNCFYLCFFVLGNVYWIFNLLTVFRLFETFKIYLPKGLCKADTEWGPIVFTYVIFWVRKRILDFQFTDGFLPFWNHENVLSPKGTLRSRTRMGSILILSILLCLEKGIWHIQFTSENLSKKNLKMFYLRMGWDGWMDGWTEYQKCPLIFFILCGYIDYVYDYLHTK